MLRKIYLVVFMLICFTGVAFGENLITPFGSLSWEDGFFDTVTKLNKMQSIEKIELVTKEERENLKGINKDDLNKLFSGLLENKFGNILKKKDDYRLKMIFDTYKDKNGVDQKYTERIKLTIEAYPILIASTPFKISLIFTSAKGLSVHQPDKVIIEKKWNTAFPLVLTRVVLLSTSPSIADNFKKINALIEKKYGKYSVVGLSFGKGLRGQVYDNTGSMFAVESGLSKYLFSYYSEAYIKKLNEIYRQHLGNLESNKIKGKKDMGSDL
ncbi:MAG: hypothetical protein PF482_19145 [Desulfobacteraceae bacterium]|jgi:hypothetical protein|nr:hypothetical protein [Desulfobacteraceae bacterium]